VPLVPSSKSVPARLGVCTFTVPPGFTWLVAVLSVPDGRWSIPKLTDAGLEVPVLTLMSPLEVPDSMPDPALLLLPYCSPVFTQLVGRAALGAADPTVPWVVDNTILYPVLALIESEMVYTPVPAVTATTFLTIPVAESTKLAYSWVVLGLPSPVPLMVLSVNPPLSSNTVPPIVKLVNGMVMVFGDASAILAESSDVNVKLTVPLPLNVGSTVNLVES